MLKYWTCKRSPVHAAEALECLGGNGYVEEWGMARLYREAPLNSIWEGSGNVQCLDVLRAIQKTPESLGALFSEIWEAKGGDHRLDIYVNELRGPNSRRPRIWRCGPAAWSSAWPWPSRPRCSCATPRAEVADAFCASRLAGDGGRAFGTLPPGTDFKAILERVLPG